MKKFYVIGRTEKISIPMFEIKDIESKIDTGAYTSSIDCSEIELFNDGKTLKFKVLDKDNTHYVDNWYIFEKWSKTDVTSSNGQKEERYMITVEIEIDGIKIDSDFTLTNRSKMTYPILIGRKTIPRGWYVDVHNQFNF